MFNFIKIIFLFIVTFGHNFEHRINILCLNIVYIFNYIRNTLYTFSFYIFRSASIHYQTLSYLSSSEQFKINTLFFDYVTGMSTIAMLMSFHVDRKLSRSRKWRPEQTNKYCVSNPHNLENTFNTECSNICLRYFSFWVGTQPFYMQTIVLWKHQTNRLK